MKKLVLAFAIVFTFGVTYAVNIPTESQKSKTEQVSSISKDEKEKKEATSEKKKECCEKTASEKSCCSEKKTTAENK